MFFSLLQLQTCSPTEEQYYCSSVFVAEKAWFEADEDLKREFEILMWAVVHAGLWGRYGQLTVLILSGLITVLNKVYEILIVIMPI